MSLAGKTIVITGASSGIGAQLARVVSARGANVVLVARREKELNAVAAECGGSAKALVFPCDVTKKDSHEKLLAASLAKFGKVDCYVNNAGVGMSKPALEVTEEDLDSMISVNTKSALFGMQVAVKYFMEQKAGHVINVSSMLGRIPFASFRAAYCASKAAINSLTTNVRVDLQSQGFSDIHVCLFIPGVVATDFGVNAVNGGPDSRTIPNAQPVEEVADILAAAIEHPEASVDIYSRPQYKSGVVSYYSAEDVRVLERQPPFSSSPSPSKA
mmetsp:Transcript_85678/g.228436  ORF Transcript_85678/g.228436 Transcript_85678/m.228436 type:complete len:272 (+) Transcript_85678:179-994(+)